MKLAGSHTVTSPEAMQELGARFAQSLHAGDVVALDGELGAGKTQLVKGIVRGLSGTSTVTSPTFTLVHEYPSPACTIYHIDLYRLEHPDELEHAGITELLPPQDGISLVEWAAKFPNLLPPNRIRIRIIHDPADPALRLVKIRH